ncbi:ABC transporter ATP-binding protein [Nocardioides insulae]|uniref:ABC transporter ATP-binding protein n=1 Tax=Nocardioides insulae TaxID=394734 RepID=UPI00041DE5ED|nr:ABC transporter ATP-binding protein [Nocardioides insulae]
MSVPAIAVRGASRVYASADRAPVEALGAVDLTVDRGRFVSVIGPSGCGKSTLLRLVAGLESPDTGSIEVGGEPPERAAAAKRLGLVPQRPALLPWLSVLKNVTLPARMNRRADRGRTLPDAAELLRKAGLGEAMHVLPGELSGGMQQRAAIVRAFGLHPDVLLMDEPFSALDEFTREALQEQLLDLWEELRATVLFVTHSISEAIRLSDQVVVMAARPGRILEVVDIDLPRPRTQDLVLSPDFHDYEVVVRQYLRDAFDHEHQLPRRRDGGDPR